MRVTNRLNLPQPIVDAVSNDDYSRGPSDISVTSLISPVRLVALREAHSAELEEDASDLIFALIGKMIHKILETAKSANMLAVAEQRLYMLVGPYVLSGALDRVAMLQDLQTGKIRIEDYKTASVNEMIYGVRLEREQQLNIYRVLAELNGYSVEELEAIFILRDWSKVKAYDSRPTPTLTGGMTESDYPQEQVVRHPLRMWSNEEAYEFIGRRMTEHMAAQERYAFAIQNGTDDPQGELPECTDEERWSRHEGFAVTKANAKRATKVFVGDTAEAEAQAYIDERPGKDYILVPRAGRSVRCMFYCPVAAICEQFKELQSVS